MPAPKPDSEDILEQAAIALFTALGWRTVNASHERSGPQGTLGRDHRGEVVLLRELRAAIDLSQIDFAALQAKFAQGRKHTAVEQLRGTLNAKLRQMVRLNKSRMDYRDTFQRLIDDYHAGATTIDQLWAQLFGLTQALSAEEQRHVAKQISEEALALFDVLTKPEVTLSYNEQAQVKALARGLLATLKRERLVLDWRKKQQARARVQIPIEEGLAELPDAYTTTVFQEKISAVYQHVSEHCASATQHTYASAT